MKDAPLYDVRITRRSGEAAKFEAKVRKAIRAVLRRHGVTRARIGVALVSDAAMARLNRDHLGRHGPTDVLSFDLRDPADEKTAIDGEIVMDRLNDGQFDDCDITLREIRQVEDSLVKTLCGIYHGRVSYPKARKPREGECDQGGGMNLPTARVSV